MKGQQKERKYVSSGPGFLSCSGSVVDFNENDPEVNYTERRTGSIICSGNIHSRVVGFG